MKCPWCWKKITFMVEARKPGTDPNDDDINGALQVCSGCHRFAIIETHGQYIKLRRLNAQEEVDMAAQQAAALALPPGSFTPDNIARIMDEIRRDYGTKH